jgi:hypothetical protein
MISEQPAVNLRPMSIGEILDRAFTVYFKNILVLTAALIVVLIPMLVLNYLAQHDLLGLDLKMFDAAMKNPNAPPPPPDINQLMSFYTSPYLGLTIMLAIFALPFANSAIIAGISRSYLGQPVRFVDCYRDALARWQHVLILAVLWIVALFVGVIVAYIALIIIVLVFALAGAALIPNAPAAGIIIALLFIPALLWLMIASLQVYLAWALSFAAVTLERVDPVKAFASGFSRVFSRGTYWRSAGVSAAMLGIVLVFEIIVGGAMAALFYWLKLPIDSAPLAFSGFSGIASAVITPLSFAIVAMYYYDIRIRREGFDLDHLNRMLSRGEPPLPTPTA